MTITRATLILTCVLFATATPGVGAKRPKPEACPGGRYYLVDGPVLTGVTSPQTDSIVAGKSSFALGDACSAKPKQYRATRKNGTRIKVVWKGCTGFDGKVVKLTGGGMTDDCTLLSGTLRVAKEPSRSIQATLSRCGDGHIDQSVGELCDDGNTADGDGCQSTCVPTPPHSSTSTSTSSSTSSSATSSSTTLGSTSTSTTSTLPTPPDLEIAAIANPDPVRPGGVLVYEATVTNQGGSTVSSVLVSLPLPTFGSEVRAISHGGKLTSGTVRWELGALAPLESRTVELTLRVATGAPVGTTLSSLVSATAPGTGDSTLVTTKVATARPLQLALVESADPVGPDAALTYTLTFGNAGAPPVVGAVLTATVPPGVSVTAVSDDGMIDGDQITWPLGILEAGDHGHRTLTVTVDDLGIAEPGTRRLAAALTAGGDAMRATALTTVDPAPLLRLDAIATPDPVAVDGVLTYELTVTNLDAIARAGVTLVLPMPDVDPDCVNATPATCSDLPGGFVTWNLGSLPAGASRTRLLTMNADDYTRTFTDGTVFATHAFVSDTAGANARASVATVLDDAEPLQLALVESADPVAPGAALTYTLDAANAGFTPVLDAVLTAVAPAGTTITSASHDAVVAGNVVTWLLGTLESGDHDERSFTVTVDDLGIIEPGTRKATAMLAAGADEARSAALTIVDPAPILRLDAIATPDPVAVDGVLTYQLTVTNLAGTARAGVTLVLAMPDIDPDCLQAGPATCSDLPGGFVTWNLGSLPAGASRTMLLTMNADDYVRTFADGTVFATHAFVTDVTGASARASLATVLDDGQPLQLALAESADPVVPGAVLTYTLTFGNAGAVPIVGAVLTAIVPAGTTVAAVSNGGTVTGDLVVWPLGDLEAGGHGQRTFAVTVDDHEAAEPGVRRATATLAAGAERAHASALTTVDPAPILRLDAIATPDPVDVDGVLTYQLTVTNLDVITRAGVTLVLAMPDIDPDCLNAAPATCSDLPGGVVTWSIGSLPAGASRMMLLTMNADDYVRTFADGTVFATHASVTDVTGANARASLATVLDDAQPLDLAMVESADPVVPDAPLTYTLTFGNAGATPRTGAVLVAVAPPGTTITGASHAGTIAGDVVTWPLGDLAAGAHGQRTLSVTVDDLGVVDPGTRLASATLAAGTARARASALTTVDPAPILQLDVFAAPDPVAVDSVLTYQLTVTNLDAITRAGVTLVLAMPDIDPDCLTAAPATCSDLPGGYVTWNLGALAAGTFHNMTLTMTADDYTRSFPDGTVFATHAFVTDVTGANARASVAVRLAP